MPDRVKEKLIELLQSSPMDVLGHRGVGSLADHLIANGVTVQEWISVKDRLPDNDTYILVTTDGVTASAYWHNDRFYAFTASGVATVGCVTHWMPLPQPPTGE